jgi:glycosyl transferase family 25
MKFFCINIKSAVDRKVHCITEFEREQIDVQFVSGFPAKLSSVRHVATTLSMGMVGCFISHERLLEEISRNDYNNTVIFEDDVKLNNGFKLKLENVLQTLPSDFDIAFLGWYKKGLLNSLVPVNNDWFTVGSAHVWGTHAYLIKNGESAAKILDTLHPIRNQVDLQILEDMRNGKINGYLLKTPICHQGGFQTQVQIY